MNNYQHPGMKNEGSSVPYANTLEAFQELNAYELENTRSAVEGLPTLSNPDPNLSPDFLEFSNTQEMKIQQELYNRQESPVSSIRTRLCELRDKLNSRRTSLKSQLRQVEEQLQEVHKQLGKLS
ncbi:MAG: hypothetical protein AAGE84_23365 [Cyanobacteria bacterium P01_G01_bin.39]